MFFADFSKAYKQSLPSIEGRDCCSVGTLKRVRSELTNIKSLFGEAACCYHLAAIVRYLQHVDAGREGEDVDDALLCGLLHHCLSEHGDDAHGVGLGKG